MKYYEERNEQNSENSEVITKKLNELREKKKLNEEFYEKKCCYNEGFLGYIQEMMVIAGVNILFIIISIVLNKCVLFKNNNYINLVKNSSNSLSNFEKFWCNAGNNELIVLSIYLGFIIILIIFIISLVYTYKKRIPLNIETIIENKNKIIAIYFPLYIVFYIFFSLINYLIVYSIIFISISPIEYPGVFNIANKNKTLTLDEEIEIEDAVEEFKDSKFIHILYIIILFIILYLNILISRLIYNSIIYNKKEEIEEREEKKDFKEKQKEEQKEDKMQEKYNWKYPRINIIYKFLESFYLGLFLILHLSSFLFQLNISKEEKYKELLNSVEEGEIENPKNYSILKMYGNFGIVITCFFFLLNLISFVIVIVFMYKKMLGDNITKGLYSEKPKLFSVLLASNILYSIFVILLIAFPAIYYSSFNELDKKGDTNYFVIKKN
jgi:hypothetical protein